MDFKDYYKSLGVSPDADDKTIKKAYQKLAKKYHPDVNPGDKAAEEKFKEATEAYQAISDPDKRRKYDELRQDYQQWQTHGGRGDYNWERWQTNPGGGYAHKTYTMSPEDFADLFGGMGDSGRFNEFGGSYSDFFSTLFGGMGRGMGRGFKGGCAREYAQAGQDLEVEVQVTLEEAYHGTTRVIRTSEKQIRAKIPKGVRTGSKVRLAGQGRPRMAGGLGGDLYLIVTISPHTEFTREGDNLKVKLPVDFYQAVLGGKANVRTLDGEVRIKIPPLTQNGKKFRLKGKGMPKLEHPNQYGDLFAELSIVLPKNMSTQEITALRDLSQKRAKQNAI